MKTRPMTTRIDREYTDRSAELEKKMGVDKFWWL